MKVSRRDFLKWASLSAVGAVACNVFPEREMNIQSPTDLPEDLVTGQDNWYATLCCQCPEKEGILVRVMEGRAKKVRGQPPLPHQPGKQSARCEAGLQALYHPNRLSGPMLRSGPRGSGAFRPIGWTEAGDLLRGSLKGLRDNNDPNAMLMITEPLRGHLGLVVRRFVEAYGGRHMAFESLGERTLRSTLGGIFGQSTLPNFDIENSRYLLSFGADWLSTWVSPVRFARGYGDFRGNRDGKERGTFVHVDPRYSVTAANSDLWIPVLPGREGILATSICSVIIGEGLGDQGMAAAMGGAAGLDDYRPDKVVRPEDPPVRGHPRKHPRRARGRHHQEGCEGVRDPAPEPGHRRRRGGRPHQRPVQPVGHLLPELPGERRREEARGGWNSVQPAPTHRGPEGSASGSVLRGPAGGLEPGRRGAARRADKAANGARS